MAGKKNAKPQRRHSPAPIIAILLLLSALAVMLWAAHCANTLYVRRAVVSVADLPEAFEGVTLLYASDIDLCGLNTAAKAKALFQTLQALRPDMLILGGDYTSDTLFEHLNTNGQGGDALRKARDVEALFRALSALNAPLGKYAISTPDDGDKQALAEMMTINGVTPVFNICATIRVGRDELVLIGLCDAASRVDVSSYHIGASDCVIALTASPDALPRLMTLEAPGGGALIDLALTGHTHGGQIMLFGHSMFTLTDNERRYLYGWKREADVPVLTTSGVGCEGVNLRLGTRPEVWLIQLTRERTYSNLQK